MKKVYILTLLILSIVLYSFVDIQENEEILLFESLIGPETSGVSLQVFDLETENFMKTLEINLIKEEQIVFRDTLVIEMDDEPLIDLIEINGDGIKDLRIEYLRPGRGGNNVYMVFLYDSNLVKLDEISNSVNYPNLCFDKKLKSIFSFRFYGGSGLQMDYLEILNDTLLSKHKIIKEDQRIYIKKFLNGKWVERNELKLKSDDIIIPEIIELEPEIKIKNAS
jgi:hypothetical protein